MRAWRPLLIAAAALVLAALLNADELARTAERQPVGRQRDVLVDLAALPQDVADVTRLDRPRQWVESLLGEEQPAPATGVLPPTPTPTTATTGGDADLVADLVAGPDPGRPALDDGSGTARPDGGGTAAGRDRR